MPLLASQLLSTHNVLTVYYGEVAEASLKEEAGRVDKKFYLAAIVASIRVKETVFLKWGWFFF